MDGAVEMIGVGKGLMGQEVAFEVAPGSLDIVQLRGIFGQPFEGEPTPLGERGTGSFAGMDRAVVENEGDGFLRASWARPVNRVEAAQSGDEVGAAFGCAGIDDQLVWAAQSRKPSSARLRAWPGAWTRRSAPRLAQARAR
jgi:hypothetical protein